MVRIVSNVKSPRIVQKPENLPKIFQRYEIFQEYKNPRVAEVEGAQERRSTKDQGLLRKEGPPAYAILP